VKSPEVKLRVKKVLPPGEIEKAPPELRAMGRETVGAVASSGVKRQPKEKLEKQNRSRPTQRRQKSFLEASDNEALHFR